MINVESILQQLGVDYKPTSNGFKASCPNPNHGDSTPSWHIENAYPYRHNCFGCGYKGNIVTLARDFGIQVEGDEFSTDDWGTTFKEHIPVERKEWIPEIRIDGELKNPIINREVMAYLSIKRGIGSDFIKRYQIHYADTGCKINDMRFDHRVCVPIIDNKVIWSIEGRTYRDRMPKVLYPKGSRMDTLFDIDNLDRNEPLIVVEGIMDLPPVFYAGYNNITAVFGANITYRQRKLLNEFKSIVFLFDNDDAGRNSILNIPSFLHTQWKVGVLPSNRKDPGECTKEEIREVVDKAMSYTRYLLCDKESPLDWV